MEKKRIYPASQLVVALDANVLKTYMWILAWQGHGSVKYYPRQFAKATKFTEEEVEKCIQALVNCKLIDVSYVDQTWMITPNAEQVQKYYEVPLADVLEGKGIKMADKATWNKTESEKSSTSSSGTDFENMSADQLEKMLLMLQARLNEKKEVEKLVTVMSEPASANKSDLPF